MKKSLLAAVFASLFPVHAFALNVENCADNGGVILNNVTGMQNYADGTVKLFEIDQIEPAAAPMGVAVAIDRGDDLSEMESFCRYVSGLGSVDLRSARMTESNGVLTVVMDASVVDDLGNSLPKTLTLEIRKDAKSQNDLVAAKLN